jgi:PPE family
MDMAEQNGFTGRVWEATPADKLVHDLVTGPGAMPMANTSAAFGRLSTVLAEAAMEYQAILGELGAAWRSTDSDVGVQRLTPLRNWMTEAAEAAAGNAARADAQAVAYLTAVAAMPSAAEQAAWQAVQELVAQGIPLGGPLLGMAASIEDQSHAAKSRAAQVMRDYETATAPVAQPWTPPPPPRMTNDTALRAAQQQAAQRAFTPRTGAPQLMPIAPGSFVPGVLPTPAAALGETAIVDEPMATDIPTSETAAPTMQAAQTPMAPGAMTPAAATASEGEYTKVRPTAGPGGHGVLDELGAEAGWATAPPVVGGIGTTRLRTINAGPEAT